MYTLRTIKNVKNANPLNQFLGNRYSLATPVDKTPEDWEKEIKQYYPEIPSIEGIVAIVIGDEARLIYEDYTAYIMNANGRTLERIN